MNNRKIFALSFFFGGTMFLGFGFSLLFGSLGSDTWIAALLGTIIGCIILFDVQKLKEKAPTNWGIIYKTIYFFFLLFIFSQILFIFQNFASSFFLIKSPNWFISLPVPFIVYRISKSGINTIAKVAEILTPIAIFLLTITIIGLIKYWDINNFLPVLTNKPQNIIEGALYFASYSLAPFFLFLPITTETNNYIPKYLFSMLFIFLLCLSITAVLGPNLIKIYRYPEYMVLKEIQLFDFIEKIENITSIAWLFNLFIILSLSGYQLKECLPNKKKKITFPLLLGLLYFIAVMEGKYYPFELSLYHILPYILGAFELIFIIGLFLMTHKRKQ